MRYNPMLKATRCAIIGSWKGQNAGDWCFDAEVGAFGFWDFKIPKAFRPQLFDCYPLTGQDSIYPTVNLNVHFDLPWGEGGFSRLFISGDYGWWNPPLRYRKLYDRASTRHDIRELNN